MLQDAEAIYVRHHEVQDDEIGRRAAEQVDSNLTVLCELDHEPLVGERLFEYVAGVLIVLDDQHSRAVVAMLVLGK